MQLSHVTVTQQPLLQDSLDVLQLIDPPGSFVPLHFAFLLTSLFLLVLANICHNRDTHTHSD